MSSCTKIGYEVSGDIPSGYRSGPCDPCDSGDCCRWMPIPGIPCADDCICCPHPSGTIRYADNGEDFSGDLTSNKNPFYFAEDNGDNVISGYGKYFNSVLVAGLVSVVDDAGDEYFSTHPYAFPETSNVFSMVTFHEVTLFTYLGKNASVCGPGRWNDSSCSGYPMVKYYAESGVFENTPTPVTTQTQLSPSFYTYNTQTYTTTTERTETTHITTRPTNDPTFTDTNTDVLIGDDGTTFKKLTDTPAGQTPDPDGGLTSYMFGGGVHQNQTSTAAGQTDTTYLGRIVESFTPTPTPMWLDTTVRTTTRDLYTYFTTSWEEANVRGTATSRETEVSNSPPWKPYVSIQGQPTTASGESPNLVTSHGGANWWGDVVAEGYYYEPVVGAKLTMTQMGNQNEKNYVVCTDGNNNFKRLGSGDKISADGITIGEAFHPMVTNNGANGFEDMYAKYPYNYQPSSGDCREMAQRKVIVDSQAEAEALGFYGKSLPFEAQTTGVCDYVTFDPSLSTNEKMGNNGHRDYIVGFKTASGMMASQLYSSSSLYNPTPRWEANVHSTCFLSDAHREYNEFGGGGGSYLFGWHGCETNTVGGGNAILSGDGHFFSKNWHQGTGSSGFMWSQRSQLNAINNWVKAKLGSEWRVARAHEIISEVPTVSSGCRMKQTHPETEAVGDFMDFGNTGAFHANRWDNFITDTGDYGSSYGNAEAQRSTLADSFFYSPGYFENCGNCSGYLPDYSQPQQVETTSGFYTSSPINTESWTYPGSFTTKITSATKSTPTPVTTSRTTQTNTIVTYTPTTDAIPFTTFTPSEFGTLTPTPTSMGIGQTTTNTIATYTPTLTSYKVTNNTPTESQTPTPTPIQTSAETSTTSNFTTVGLTTDKRATYIYTDKLTTTYTWGTQGTQNPITVTPTPVLASVGTTVLGVVTADGTLTEEKLTPYIKNTHTIVTTSEPLRVPISNLGMHGHVPLAFKRFSDWCIHNKGCGPTMGDNNPLFGGSDSKNKSRCGKCNEVAYQNLTGWDVCGGSWSALSSPEYYDNYFVNRYDSDLGVDVFSFADGAMMDPPNIDIGHSYFDVLHEVVMSKDSALHIGSIFNSFNHDYARSTYNTFNERYVTSNHGLHPSFPGVRNPFHAANHATQIDVTSWLSQPENFYKVSESIYEKSRCCNNGKPTRDTIRGMSCINLRDGDYCISGAEVQVNLGTGTGDFIGVVNGGVYWDDITDLGASLQGNANTNYSFGYGLQYPSGDSSTVITGNTDDGDSRYLSHFTKTETGNNDDETGNATLFYATKVFKGTTAPGGQALVTCPGKTGDTDCYSATGVAGGAGAPAGSLEATAGGGGIPFGEGNITSSYWGGGGKTYIMGTDKCIECKPPPPPTPPNITGISGISGDRVTGTPITVYLHVGSGTTSPISGNWDFNVGSSPTDWTGQFTGDLLNNNWVAVQIPTGERVNVLNANGYTYVIPRTAVQGVWATSSMHGGDLFVPSTWPDGNTFAAADKYLEDRRFEVLIAPTTGFEAFVNYSITIETWGGDPLKIDLRYARVQSITPRGL